MTTAKTSPVIHYIRRLATALPAPELSDGQLLERFAGRVAATVDGEAILEEDVYAASYLALPEARDLAGTERARRITAGRKEALDRVIERELILQDAFRAHGGRNARLLDCLQETAAEEFSRRWVMNARRSAGLKDDEELGAYLRAQGTSLDAVRRRWERDFMAEEYLQSRVRRGRGPGSSPDEQVARQERERIVGALRRQAVIEYTTGR